MEHHWYHFHIVNLTIVNDIRHRWSHNETKFLRKSLFEAFRGFQALFGEARERAVKAIAFAKLLRKDLEVIFIPSLSVKLL